MEKNNSLKLVLEIARDVNGANKQNGTTWNQWKLSEIAKYYKFPDASSKFIISRAINSNGETLTHDIEELERTVDQQTRFNSFVDGLTELSKRTGVVIRATGGVDINDLADAPKIEYKTDFISGDLEPIYE